MTFNDFLRVVEIRTKIVSLSGFLIGTSYALYHLNAADPLIIALMFVAVLLVDMGTTAFNTFFDFESGVDTKQFNAEGDKVLVHRGVAPGHALLISAGMFLAAAVLGIVLAFMVGVELLLVGAASMAVGFFYNGGPHPISRTPLGELVAGGFLGWVLVVLCYYVQTGTVTAEAALVGLPSLLLVASILTVNNTCDIEGDAAAGRKTLSILLGERKSRVVVYALGAGAYIVAGLLVAQGIVPVVTAAFLVLSLILMLREHRAMHRRGFSHETKGANMGSISRIFVSYSLAMLVGLWISILVPSL
jgi:1,4-dihydroxy-2-naphthoate octaprenyltransferase